MGIITRFSHATGAPLQYRMVVYYHERVQQNGTWIDRYNYVYDWYEKPSPKTGNQPNFTYYEKKLMDFFLGSNLKKTEGKTIKRAVILPNTGEQKIIREYGYREMLEQTFNRVIQYSCSHSMSIIYRYYGLMAKGGPTARHIASSLMHYFETLDWSKSTNERVHSFFVNGKVKVEEVMKGLE